ncbi:MAG: hypothetical protein R3297_10845 [Desulfobulbales bacterium]|nr:hypothetical protein [Desulfobulbales bacterium]
MPPEGKRKKTAKKRKRQSSRKRNRSFSTLLRQWFMPLSLLLFIFFSLAATFYLVFLHTPATPLF